MCLEHYFLPNATSFPPFRQMSNSEYRAPPNDRARYDMQKELLGKNVTVKLLQVCEKRTGETSLCGKNKARGIWADVSSLSVGHWDPLPHCFFPSQVPRRKKTRGREGRRDAFWKEIYPWAQRGETDVLAMRTIRSNECGVRMGFPQAENTLAVAVIGMQERPAPTAITVWQLQQLRLF